VPACSSPTEWGAVAGRVAHVAELSCTACRVPARLAYLMLQVVLLIHSCCFRAPGRPWGRWRREEGSVMTVAALGSIAPLITPTLLLMIPVPAHNSSRQAGSSRHNRLHKPACSQQRARIKKPWALLSAWHGVADAPTLAAGHDVRQTREARQCQGAHSAEEEPQTCTTPGGELSVSKLASQLRYPQSALQPS
jgi:hypothetical protein